jgi:outer membrane lipoprotein-sorting protein
MFIKYKPLINDSLMSTITIAMKGNLIDSIDIEHSQRQKIHIDLMDIEMNKMIDDGFFSDLIPNDAEVIE